MKLGKEGMQQDAVGYTTPFPLLLTLVFAPTTYGWQTAHFCFGGRISLRTMSSVHGVADLGCKCVAHKGKLIITREHSTIMFAQL